MKTILLLIGIILMVPAFGKDLSSSHKPSSKEINAMFFETKEWPKTLHCVREQTLHITDHINTLNQDSFYHLDFEGYKWENSKYKGDIEYLGSTGEFSASFILRGNGGFPYRVIELVSQTDGLYLTRADIVGKSVFAYWSKCSASN